MSTVEERQLARARLFGRMSVIVRAVAETRVSTVHRVCAREVVAELERLDAEYHALVAEDESLKQEVTRA